MCELVNQFITIIFSSNFFFAQAYRSLYEKYAEKKPNKENWILGAEKKGNLIKWLISGFTDENRPHEVLQREYVERNGVDGFYNNPGRPELGAIGVLLVFSFVKPRFPPNLQYSVNPVRN